VLHTLGAGPRLLARALIAEQGVLAGVGVGVGLLVGLGVAAALGPPTILAPNGERPVPPAVLDVAWTPVALTAAGLLVVALGMSGLTATAVRPRLAAAQLRIGDDR
jgi:ABC-type antimicrobial peptide transport system permease subunit